LPAAAFVGGFQPLDRDVQIPHDAEIGVQPLQFAPLPAAVENRQSSGRKQYGRAQASEHNAI